MIEKPVNPLSSSKDDILDHGKAVLYDVYKKVGKEEADIVSDVLKMIEQDQYQAAMRLLGPVLKQSGRALKNYVYKIYAWLADHMEDTTIKKSTTKKLTALDLKKLIKEELEVVEQELLESEEEILSESLPKSTLSKVEMEEMLRNYFKSQLRNADAGQYSRASNPIPQEIHRLSVLFPILEKAGLGDVVDRYIRVKKTQGPDIARQILKDLGKVLNKIQSDPDGIMDDPEYKEKPENEHPAVMSRT